MTDILHLLKNLPKDHREDFDGRSWENPYKPGIRSALWQEQEYWRHWNRFKEATGSWPVWSIVYHVFFIVGTIAQLFCLVMLGEMRRLPVGDWLLLTIVLTGIWAIVRYAGRRWVRKYEADAYAKAEAESSYYIRPG